MLLPKKIDIDKAKVNERKLQIDEGLTLARKIDQLRQDKLQLETNFKLWKEQTSKAIQIEIDDLVENKRILSEQILEATKTRNEVVEPLDEEWKRVKKEQKSIEIQKNELYLDRERFETEANKLVKEKELVSKYLIETEENRMESKQYKEKAKTLRNKIEIEYQNISAIRENQESESRKELLKVGLLKKEYEVALKTILLKEKQVEEKEEDLSIREKDLARRIANLQRAQDIK